MAIVELRNQALKKAIRITLYENVRHKQSTREAKVESCVIEMIDHHVLQFIEG